MKRKRAEEFGPPGAPPRVANKWLVAAAVMLGTMMEILDITIANVSLPHMRGTFSATTDEITWVLTSYLVASSVVIPMSGWLSAIFGRKRYFIMSILLFTAGSVLCGAAPTLAIMVAARVIQGAGGAAMIPTSQAILMETFPKEQHGLAMAMWGLGVTLAPAVGPTLGGWITDNYSWRWIFYINFPPGLLAALLVALFVPEPSYVKRKLAGVDYLGVVLLTMAIGCGQVVLDRGERADWFAARWVVGFSAVSIMSMAALALWELRARDPVLDLRLLRSPTFALGSSFMGIFSGVMYGSLILLPIFLQEFLGYTAWLAGLVTVPRALAVMVAMIITGPLLSRTDPKLSIVAGFVCMAVSMWQIGHYNVEVDFWHVVTSTLLQGFGMGMAFVALSTWALTGVGKERMGYGSALFNVIRNTGASAGIAIVSTLLVRWAQWYQGTLVTHVNRFSKPAKILLERLDPSLLEGGADIAQAAPLALERLYWLLQQQAAMLAFNQIHRDLMVVMALLAVTALGVTTFVLLRRRCQCSLGNR